MMHPEVLAEQNKVLFSRLTQFPAFYLAGGTALALQIGHRISADFDLFSHREIEEDLLLKIELVYSDFSLKVSVNSPEELTVFVGNVKLTFLYYPFPVLFDLIPYEGVKLLSIKEIAATKAYTIGRRGSYKDYVDLYFILSERHASLEGIIEIAEKKYADKFNGRLFLEQLIYFADIKDTEIELLRGGLLERGALEKFFESEIKKVTLL